MIFRTHTPDQRGAVSLFIVVFTALLIVTISVAFVRIMVQDQQQASANDLSKSAMDSALAGVEDAKRAIVSYVDNCQNDGPEAGTPYCDRLELALGDGTKCDTLQQAGIVGDPDPEAGGWLIKQIQSSNDEALQQAYTCVKIQLDTADFVDVLAPGASTLIPLEAEGPFNTVSVKWFSAKELQNSSQEGVPGTAIDLGTELSLPKQNDWPSNRPAILRTQLIQFGENFQLSDFDQRGEESERSAATLFLFPLAGIPDADGTNTNFSLDNRSSGAAGALQAVACDKDFSMNQGGAYACQATIVLPNPVGESDGNKRKAYLRINALYNVSTNVSVGLKDNDKDVKFKAVQPLVDSTGRANDIFRRVQSRINLESGSEGGSSPTPSIDITGSLCKTFRVTDAEYKAGVCEE